MATTISEIEAHASLMQLLSCVMLDRRDRDLSFDKWTLSRPGGPGATRKIGSFKGNI
jgi:hypothetical protein